LVIECPFTLRSGDEVDKFDPQDRARLGPLLALYPGRVERMAMTPDGTLEATFASGTVLSVPPHPRFEAWNIAGFWCPPGGFS